MARRSVVGDGTGLRAMAQRAQTVGQRALMTFDPITVIAAIQAILAIWQKCFVDSPAAANGGTTDAVAYLRSQFVAETGTFTKKFMTRARGASRKALVKELKKSQNPIDRKRKVTKEEVDEFTHQAALQVMTADAQTFAVAWSDAMRVEVEEE